MPNANQYHVDHPQARTGVYAVYPTEYDAQRACADANDVGEFLLGLSEFSVRGCNDEDCKHWRVIPGVTRY